MNADLSQLRDIHLPEPVSWWPPALGWWLLLLLLLVLLAVAYGFYRRHRRQRWRRAALAELQRLQQHCTGQALVAELSTLLRRVAITRFPRDEVASLTGDKWLVFLDRQMKRPQFQKSGRLLITAPYSNSADVKDAAQLCTLVEQWIKGVA